MIKTLLALETSTQVARVGVFDLDTGARLAEASAQSERHSSNLLRLCVEATAQAGVAIAELAAIACGAGPGSFTGLRVGYAVAKGLAMPFDLPFLAVSSLQALAWDMAPLAWPEERLLPCLDAGKGQIYVAPFERGAGGGEKAAGTWKVERRGEDWVIAPDAVVHGQDGEPAVMVAGTGASRYRERLGLALGARARFVEVAGPSADAIAAHALPRLRRGEREDLGTAVPAYGRAPDITRPKVV